MDDVTPPGHTSPPRAFTKLLLLTVIVVGGVTVTVLSPLGEMLSPQGVQGLIEDLRGSFWAPLLFIGLYVMAAAFAIPGTVLTLAGGALFGLFWGSVVNTIAANLGASAAFLISRLLGRDGIARLAGKRLARIDEATTTHGFRGLLTLRLVPLVPFNALNFGAGLTSISWTTYASATVLGILPGTVVYTMFADALLDGSREASAEALLRVAVSGGLLLLLSFTPQITKRLRAPTRGAAG